MKGSECRIIEYMEGSKKRFVKSVEIGDGIYVLTSTNTQSKLSVLRRVFKMYDADPMDMVFYLRDENDIH